MQTAAVGTANVQTMELRHCNHKILKFLIQDVIVS